MFGEKRSRAFAFAKLLGPSNAIATEYIQPSLDTVTSSITSIQSSLDSVATVAANITGGSESYTSVANLPLSGNDVGSLAFVQETNRLYIWNGTGWFNIALINTNPTITQGSDALYTLATDGTPTVITLEASDPEGVPIQWSYEVTSGSLTNGGGITASITQSNNTFIITPSTSDAYSGLFELTFTASDGVNIDTTSSSFSLQFIAPGGGVLYRTPGTYSWVCPAGVYSVSVVCVGGGGGGAYYSSDALGGGGGGLSWKNNITVVPGQSYTVEVGAGGAAKTVSSTSDGNAGGNSYFGAWAYDENVCCAAGGQGGRYLASPGTTGGGSGGFWLNDGGGNGGPSSPTAGAAGSGAGGAGGYSGSGGQGRGYPTTAGAAGAGGAGQGGGGTSTYGYGGGGVGIYGEGASGNNTSGAGAGGSGGANASGKTGGWPGGGGGSGRTTSSGAGGDGAVRIIWGTNRAFPSTNVDLASSTDGETTI